MKTQQKAGQGPNGRHLGDGGRHGQNGNSTEAVTSNLWFTVLGARCGGVQINVTRLGFGFPEEVKNTWLVDAFAEAAKLEPYKGNKGVSFKATTETFYLDDVDKEYVALARYCPRTCGFKLLSVATADDYEDAYERFCGKKLAA